MNFLIDTNILIPLEPTSKVDLGINTNIALEFHNLSSASGNHICIHPAIESDINRDRNRSRQELRRTLLQRYTYLPAPPNLSILDTDIVGNPPAHSNDWVDNNLLAALYGDAVDYLVTEDAGIHKKAKRLGLHNRVLRLNDAIALIHDLFDSTPSPPTTVETVYTHQLDSNDSIFKSLRKDYGGPIFDEWLSKCKRAQRKAFIVKADSNQLAALTILKREDSLPDGTEGKVLKICTFKVSDQYSGSRLGELLLKPIFEFVEQNLYDYAYFTTFPKQNHLIEFAREFGFIKSPKSLPSGEIALVKCFKYKPSDIIGLDPLDFNILYGPRVSSFEQNATFIVPIQPTFHVSLFPELSASQRPLFSTFQKPCGNSIRKAYLCHSPTRKIRPGDNLCFYRSRDLSALTCLGVVEETYRSTSSKEIARYVGKRTVYSYPEIESLCKKEVLAILFRLSRPITPNITLRNLMENSILKAQPQSITELNQSSTKWIRAKIEK